MSKVKDLLIARRREIEAEAGALQAELEEIDAALSVIEPKKPVRKERRRTAAKAKPHGTRPKERAKRPPARQPSIADQSMGLLQQNPEGLDTGAIVRKLDERYGRKAGTRTVSTQLSALKRQGRLRQEGKRWKLPASQPEVSAETAEPAT